MLLVLTQVYRPEPNFITAEVAEALAGHMNVTVVTSHPNYPLGRFYEGTKWWRITRTEENGVTIWRLPLFPDQSLSVVRRAISYLSFALAAAIVAPFVARSPKTVWVYHGAFTTALAALWFRWFRGSKIVFTCADLWPESFLAAGVARPGLLVRLSFAYSRAINRAAHLLICCTRGTLERYTRDGTPQERLRYVPVWVEGMRALETKTPVNPDANARNIVYTGNLGPAQKLDVLIHAAAQLDASGVPVTVDIYGSGSAEGTYRVLAAEVGARNVRFHGRVSREAAFEAASTAFAQFVALQPSPHFLMTVPSKLYVALAAGTPVLCGLQGEAAAIAAESGGAVLFDPDDPASLVRAVESLASYSAETRNEMQARMKRYYADNFASEALLRRYQQLLQPASATRSVNTVAADASHIRMERQPT